MNYKCISEIHFEESNHLGLLKKVIFGGSETSSSITQVAYSELNADDVVNEHSHVSMEEVFLILDGICEFYLDGVVYILGKESVIKVAPNTTHMIKALTHTKIFYFGVAIAV